MTDDAAQDQRLLLDGFLAKLALVKDQSGLLKFMAEVLTTLLRRQGDAEFLATIQDAFATGITDLSWEDQLELASEVIRVVIDKRPEIARAWQALHGTGRPTPEGRRRTDGSEVAKPAPAPAPLDQGRAAPTATGDYQYREQERRLAAAVGELALRRLAVLRVPPAAIPSVAYCHQRPFFLFAPAFPEVLRVFLAGPLLIHCRIGLERKLYRFADPMVLASPDAWKGLLAEKQPEVWKVLVAALAKLAAAHKVAEAKQEAAALKGEDDDFKVVEMPVIKPRLFNILGVQFSIGNVKSTRRVKVKTPPSHQLEPQETEALDLITLFRQGALQAGIELPMGADFQFLRTLLDFNPRAFAQARDEIMGLVAHEETSSQFLLERFKAVDQTFNNILADILALMAFTKPGNIRFGVADLYSFCAGAARDKSAVIHKRPFVLPEIERRPQELAFQLREALRRRLHLDSVLSSVDMLIQCWGALGKKRFGHELDGALAVIAAFPMIFAKDPEEQAFNSIADIVRNALASEAPNRAAVLVQVSEIYDRIGRRSVATQ
jgi:hypothetical protein